MAKYVLDVTRSSDYTRKVILEGVESDTLNPVDLANIIGHAETGEIITITSIDGELIDLDSLIFYSAFWNDQKRVYVEYSFKY